MGTLIIFPGSSRKALSSGISPTADPLALPMKALQWERRSRTLVSAGQRGRRWKAEGGTWGRLDAHAHGVVSVVGVGSEDCETTPLNEVS